MTVARVRAALAAVTMAGAVLGGTTVQAADPPPTWLPENFTASVTGTSDYVFRGISQTFQEPAGQFTGEWTPGGGPIYVGTFISNVDFRNAANNNRLATVELDLLAGVRGEWRFLKWDLGAIAYMYPGQTHNTPALNTNFYFVEGALKTTWDVFGLFSVVANVFVSPQFQADSGTGVYMETGADYTLPWFDIALSARFARQNIEKNVRYGASDYNTWSFGISKEFFGRIVIGAAYYDTDLGKGDCFAGTSLCDARGVGYATFKF
jgi:uncharacterized protein (TIGR02001 family)